jgi:hypothetical protein
MAKVKANSIIGIILSISSLIFLFIFFLGFGAFRFSYVGRLDDKPAILQFPVEWLFILSMLVAVFFLIKNILGIFKNG